MSLEEHSITITATGEPGSVFLEACEPRLLHCDFHEPALPVAIPAPAASAISFIEIDEVQDEPEEQATPELRLDPEATAIQLLRKAG